MDRPDKETDAGFAVLMIKEAAARIEAARKSMGFVSLAVFTAEFGGGPTVSYGRHGDRERFGICVNSPNLAQQLEQVSNKEIADIMISMGM